jgi:hypothetical protein
MRVFENGVVLVCKRAGVRGELRRLHNEERNDLYSPPNIIRLIKRRRMRLAGNGVRMEER